MITEERLISFALALTAPISDHPSPLNELLTIQRQRLIDAGFILLSEPVTTELVNAEEPAPSTDGEGLIDSIETEATALVNEAETVVGEAIDGVEKTFDEIESKVFGSTEPATAVDAATPTQTDAQ